jgi:hypothetical protein
VRLEPELKLKELPGTGTLGLGDPQTSAPENSHANELRGGKHSAPPRWTPALDFALSRRHLLGVA